MRKANCSQIPFQPKLEGSRQRQLRSNEKILRFACPAVSRAEEAILLGRHRLKMPKYGKSTKRPLRTQTPSRLLMHLVLNLSSHRRRSPELQVLLLAFVRTTLLCRFQMATNES